MTCTGSAPRAERAPVATLQLRDLQSGPCLCDGSGYASCVNLKSRSLFDCVSDFVDDALAYGGYVDSVGHDYVQVNNKTLAVLAHGDALVGEMTVLVENGAQTLAHIAVGHARNSEARGGGIADEGREIGLRYLDNAEMIFKSYQGKSSLQK